MPDVIRDVTSILREASGLVEPLVRSRVYALAPAMQRVAGLHFGWWDGDGTVLGAPAGGKMLRSALAVQACRAVGGTVEAALAEAVAVELVHDASLLHDDIIDGDPVRRGRPALWAVQGVPAALLAGDALFFAAVQSLTEAPNSQRTVPVLLSCVQTLIDGEYSDTLLNAGNGVTQELTLAVAAAKTGALLACACELGALAATADTERARHLGAFGRQLGIAFQCADDLLGIWGDERMTGKPAHSDVRARKITMPVAAAMAENTPHAQALRSLYQQEDELSEEDCRRVVALLERSGARQVTLRCAERHAAGALAHLELARPERVASAELTALARAVVHRDR